MFSNMEYVYEVYREKSFTKAAERLFISQPALSATIKKVEQRVGVPLFDRGSNPIQLTEYGVEYIKCVEKFFEVRKEFEEYLNDVSTLCTGNLVIGGSTLFASYILPPIITNFKQSHPRITIDLVEADTAHLEQLLFSGAIDLLLDNYHFNDAIYDKRLVAKETLILAIPISLIRPELEPYALIAEDITGGEFQSHPSVPLHLVDGIPLIVLRHGNDTRDRLNKIWSGSGLTPTIVLELDQLSTAYHVACHGMGMTLISDTLVRETLPDYRIRYFRVDSPHVTRGNNFYYKRSRYMSKVLETFLRENTIHDPIAEAAIAE